MFDKDIRDALEDGKLSEEELKEIVEKTKEEDNDRPEE